MLKKLKEINLNIPLIVFLGYSLKVLILSPSYPDAIVLAILSGVFAFKMRLEFLTPKVKPVSDSIKEDIAQIKSALSKVNLSKISESKKYF